jgi:hypothetical protein
MVHDPAGPQVPWPGLDLLGWCFDQHCSCYSHGSRFCQERKGADHYGTILLYSARPTGVLTKYQGGYIDGNLLQVTGSVMQADWNSDVSVSGKLISNIY